MQKITHDYEESWGNKTPRKCYDNQKIFTEMKGKVYFSQKNLFNIFQKFNLLLCISIVY